MLLAKLATLALLPLSAAPGDPVEALRAHLEARRTGIDTETTRRALEEAIAPDDGETDLLADPERLRAVVRAALSPDGTSLRPGNVRESTYERGAFRADPLEYAVRLPRRYGKDEGPWPLIVALPEENRAAASHLRDRWSDPGVTERFILVAPTLPGTPQGCAKIADDGRPGGLARTLTAVRLAMESLDVDPDRVLIAGEGGTVPVALEAVRQDPGKFAGALGRSGRDLEGEVHAFRNVPLLLVDCDASGKDFFERSKARGIEDVTVQAALDEAEVFRWLGEQRRVALPENVLLTIGPTIPNACHWIQAAPMSPSAEVRAKADAEQGRIEIWASGISYVTLLLSDELVDLDAPLVVRVNGEDHRYEPERSLARMLDRIEDGSSDGGRVYTAELVVDTRGMDAAPAAPDDALRGAAEAGVVHHLSDPTRAAARGWVERDGTWFHPDDQDRLRAGERRDPANWIWSTRAQRKDVDAGGFRIDDAIYGAEDRARADAGLWPVEGDWVPLDEANARHSRASTPWRIPAPHVTLETTTSRTTAYAAIAETAHCVPILERALGVVPPLPLDVVLMREEEQYDRYAFGTPEGRRAPTHGEGLHVVLSAFFAELRLAADGKRYVYDGAGVGLWDADYENGDAFGRHAARLAFALSWIDAIDPSPKAIRMLRDGEPDPGFAGDFEDEKRLPRWLRWGVAIYAERFFFDDRLDASEAGARVWWARNWSLGNLAHAGGRAGFDRTFAFELDPSDREGSRRLMLSAGAIVAFALDGGCAPVEEAWAALRTRVGRGAPLGKELQALTEALRENEAALDAFVR